MLAILFFVMIPIIFFTLKYARSTVAAWFDEAWGYRQTVAISNSGSATTNQYIKTTLDTQALISAGKMQSNCNDIRVTNISGKILSHFIDGNASYACNTTTTSIYILVDSIPSTGTNVLIYYGNPSAPNTEPRLGTQQYPGISCRNILQHRSDSSGDGSYYITPTGNIADKIQVTCDMAYSSGGWILVWWGLPSEARYNDATHEQLNLSNNIVFNDIRVQGVNLNFSVSDTTQSTAKLSATIRTYYNQVGTAPDSPTPSVSFHDLGGSQTVKLTNSYFFFGYGNPYRVFYTCVNVSAIDDYYIGGYAPTCTPRASFNSTSVGCSGDYCNGVGRNTTPADSGLGLSLYQFQETKVYVRETNITLVTNLTAGSPANEEKSQAPVAYWKFDEGAGTVAHDSTPNQINLNFTNGAKWQTEDQCISQKCLLLPSNTNDYLITPTITANNPLNLGQSDFTIESWIKFNQPQTWGSGIFGRYPHTTAYNGNFTIDTDNGGGGLRFMYRAMNGNTDSYTLSDYSPYWGKWTHIAYTKTGGHVYLYINGILKQTFTPTVTIDINFTGGNYYVGNAGWAPGTMPNLMVDDHKIYNYARTAAQIKSDFNSKGSGSAKGNSVQMGTNTKNNDAFSNGLVGYWKMDEASGNLVDSSGNGNTGTITGTTVIPGKYGNARSFSSSSDMTAITTIPIPGSWSIATWFKYPFPSASWNTLTRGVNNDHQVIISASGLLGTYDNHSLGWVSSGFNTNTLSTAWHHLTAVGDGGVTKFYIDGAYVGTSNYQSNSEISYIGNYQGGGQQFGSLDDFRIYNRALSPKEISDLYNWAPGPVAYYKLDEGSGTTSVIDSSGNENTATMNGLTLSDWVSGKIGKALQFNNSDYLSLDVNSWIRQAESVTISGWYYHTGDTTSAPWGIMTNTAGGDGDGFWWHIKYSGGPLYLRTEDNTHGESDGTGTAFVSTGNWSYITTIIGTNKFDIYVNGVLYWSWTPSSGFSWSDINSDTAYLLIGRSYYNDSTAVNGKIDDVKIYNYTRTTKQIIEDMNAGHSAVGSTTPVGYWKFDEGQGTTVHNSISGNGDLNFWKGPSATTYPTWQNNGKFGKTIQFAGVGYPNNNNASVIYQSWMNSMTDATWSFWLNLSGTGGDRIVSRYLQSGSGYVWEIDENGTGLSIKASPDCSAGNAQSLNTSNLVLSTNAWQNIIVTHITGTGFKVYKNGVLTDTLSYTGGLCTTNTSNGIYLGTDVGVNGALQGMIDEVKIYNYVLTTDQVYQDYNNGLSMKLGSISTDSSGNPQNSSSSKYCIPGDSASCNAPIGEWKMDEKTGTNAYDTSGNGNTCTLTNSPTWVTGKIGGATQYVNPTDNYLDCGNNSSLTVGTNDFTLSAWLHPTLWASSKEYAYFYRYKDGSNDNGFDFELDTYGGVTDQYNIAAYRIQTTSPGYASMGNSSFKISKNTWSYVTVVRQGTSLTWYLNGVKYNTNTTAENGTNFNSTSDFMIGKTAWGSAHQYQGSIDQVKIYNYARTPAQVAYDYNRGGPVAQYKFDECQGTVANDSSGNGNTGTVIIGGSGTNTSAGTCTDGLSTSAWNNGKTGKFNSSLSFDGVDDYVSISSGPILNYNPVTISLWVYETGSSFGTFVIGKSTYGGFLRDAGSGTYEWDLYDGSEHNIYTSIPSYNAWHHLVGTYDGTTQKIYVDGILKNSQSISITPITTNDLGIGACPFCGPGQFTTGKIDNVRVYNYALTTDQIKTIYNNGAVNFGPSTGSP
jgi:hypothetical protein